MLVLEIFVASPVEHSLLADPVVYKGKAENLLVALCGPNAAASLKKMYGFSDAISMDSLLPVHVA